MLQSKEINSKTKKAEMPQYHYVGVDLSSQKLDTWINGKYKQYPNTEAGFASFLQAVRKLKKSVLVAFESTGSISLEDSICPPNWLRKRQEAVKAAGLQGRTDTARHSYATYHLARHKDVNALKANLGHSKGSDTLFIHYRAAATPADATCYWAILPPSAKLADN